MARRTGIIFGTICKRSQARSGNDRQIHAVNDPCPEMVTSEFKVRKMIEYRSIYRSSIDRCIDRYSYRSIYLVANRDFTDISPILHRYCTDASPTLNLHRVYWLISVDISVDTLVDNTRQDEIYFTQLSFTGHLD